MSDNIFCKTNLRADSWQDSIRKAGSLLLQVGYIEERYIDCMIDSVEKYGPYIVIDKGIALAHARPEDGVLKNGIALTTLSPPITFGSPNDPVNIMIILAASGDDEHIKLLTFIADFLNEEGHIKKILNASDDTQLKNAIGGII